MRPSSSASRLISRRALSKRGIEGQRAGHPVSSSAVNSSSSGGCSSPGVKPRAKAAAQPIPLSDPSVVPRAWSTSRSTPAIRRTTAAQLDRVTLEVVFDLAELLADHVHVALDRQRFGVDTRAPAGDTQDHVTDVILHDGPTAALGEFLRYVRTPASWREGRGIRRKASNWRQSSGGSRPANAGSSGSFEAMLEDGSDPRIPAKSRVLRMAVVVEPASGRGVTTAMKLLEADEPPTHSSSRTRA